MIQYPYLQDKEFLRKLDLERLKEQITRITILDFKTERPLVNIEGKATGGSISLNGASNMRRTASCSVAVDPYGIKPIGQTDFVNYYNITDINNIISMNKKVRIEIGIYNNLANFGYYQDYEIIWFPLGTYVIKAGNASKNSSGINISLTLNDKCALLNGDMGGIIPAGTIFSESELFNKAGTKREVEKILIKDVIRNLIVEFGGEQPEKVFINDIDDYIVKVMKWTGNKSVYLVKTEKRVRLTYEITQADTNNKEYAFGTDIGYMSEPFVYPGVLECNAGEAVAAVLDKIKNTLGNFEWFYDVDGNFHFQKIKNFLNDSKATDLLNVTKKDYYSRVNYSTTQYEFNEDNNNLISSISTAPQFPNIKNDFVVWGTKKTGSGATKPIRYHLAFDEKPDMINAPTRRALVYTDYRKLQAVLPITNDNFIESVPTATSDINKYYYDKNKKQVWAWDEEIVNFRVFPDYEVCYLKAIDWRTELYYQGLWTDNKVFTQNYYAAELNSEWPKIVNVKGTIDSENEDGIKTYTEVFIGDQSTYEYWLDFIEDNVFNVNNIGRRSKVVNDNAVNCLFPVEIPNYLYIEATGDTESMQKQLEAAVALKRSVIQVSSEIYNKLALGGSQNSAYDKIKELLYVHTTYNETLSLSIIPIYYLEPNTRITIADNDLGINGDYMIKSISLPLTTNGTSSISATKCVDKTF